MKYKCLKFDASKVKEKSIDKIILSQFDITDLPVNCNDLEMSVDAIEDMKEYILKNCDEFKGVPMKIRKRRLPYIVLGFFPKEIIEK